MRKFYLMIALFVLVDAAAQTISFPDPDFKIKLLQASTSWNIAYDALGNKIKIDTNNDGQIQVSEVLNVFKLDVSYTTSITDLTGIEYFQNLKTLDCSFCNVSNLDISALANLENLNTLNDANMFSINIAGLTNLKNINVQNNHLSSFDVSNLHQLLNLNINENQLHTIDVSGLDQLIYLGCSQCELTELDVSGNTNLQKVECYGNYFTTLDFSQNINLFQLKCQGNLNLTSLFIKNGKLDIYACNLLNSNLDYVCCDDSAVYPINLYYPEIANVNSYCSFVPGGEYYTIQGNTKFDSNADGCSSDDAYCSQMRFSITDNMESGTIVSDATGHYMMNVPATTHTITPVLENPSYFTVSPQSFEFSFPTDTNPSNQDFCIVPNGEHNNLETILFPTTPARPGFNSGYKIIYRNNGNMIQSGQLIFHYDDTLLDLIASDLAPSVTTFGELLWDYQDLQPFEGRAINLILRVNAPTDTPTVTAGVILGYSADITPVIGDENHYDNHSELKQTVVNSFDPNDKTCLEGSTITPEMVGKEVHYVIRFENTGTANAQNIVVKDMIDTLKLDITSLIPIDGSHPFITKISNTNKVEFIFENINLPFDDANNDGYVAFKIKTKPNLILGNTFSNKASIYFDYNFPIITNTATTTIELLANSDFMFEQYFKIYPNPANDVLNIETKQTIAVTSINIYNTLGQVVLVIPSAQQTQSVDVSSLKTGNYLMKVNSDKGSSSVKFVKL